MTDTISGRAIRPADCPHYDECDCELISLCPACGQPIDYCQGHGELGDRAGFAVLAAHDADIHDGCSFEGCDYMHEHANGLHAMCRPMWCAWGFTGGGIITTRDMRINVETLSAEQMVEGVRTLLRDRGHDRNTARIADDACRLWLESNPDYVEGF